VVTVVVKLKVMVDVDVMVKMTTVVVKVMVKMATRVVTMMVKMVLDACASKLLKCPERQCGRFVGAGVRRWQT
jgi:hypothetical protein